ncbi:unnamed protein product [Durusdinium trenchii]|uniref:Uncharacterized protein n=1 Tax=Durusdinium trenchii TaxID=1381693 RepID=A0ABP0K2B2_9DINO
MNYEDNQGECACRACRLTDCSNPASKLVHHPGSEGGHLCLCQKHVVCVLFFSDKVSDGCIPSTNPNKSPENKTNDCIVPSPPSKSLFTIVYQSTEAAFGLNKAPN